MSRKGVKIVLFFIVVVLTAMNVSAQEINQVHRNGHSVDIKIYFRYDKSDLDLTYMGNYETLQYVDSLLSDTSYLSTLFKIEILVQSSPEGKVEYNERLSNRRKATMEQYFTTKYPEIDPSLWWFKAIPENWEEFRQHLVEDENLPNREEIFAIVDGDRDPDAKEWLLKTMDGGKPWEYIREHILPFHRYGASILFIPKQYKSLVFPMMDVEFPVAVPPFDPVIKTPEVVISDPKVLFAVKTNLLWDAVSVINLGVEVPIGDRISIVGEVVHPWWRSWPADFTMQIESYHAEVKYWLGDRSLKEKLQGWYVGIYGGWGRYDIQPFSRTGVQGTFYDAGAEVGYSLPLSGSFNLEFNVGVGYVSTTYEDYYMVNNTDEYGDIKVIPYPWMQNSLKSVLPTRCGVSLVWTIKSGGGAR